jgi:hypothetical protein
MTGVVSFDVVDTCMTVHGGGIKHAGSSCRVPAIPGCDVSLV